MKKLTNQQIENAIKNSRATVEMEGLKPSKENDQLIRKVLKGEITEREAIQEIVGKYKMKA